MKQSVTLTFGERAENHAGMQLLGEEVDNGFDLSDLRNIRDKFENRGCSWELVNLNSFLDCKEASPASILIIRDALNAFEIDSSLLLEEQSNLEKDKKALMRGRVVNKLARYNLCFGNDDQKADYENGKGTIIAFKNVPLLQKLRDELPVWFGEKANNLLCEGNYYYDTSKCGIGYHGDSERKRVIAETDKERTKVESQKQMAEANAENERLLTIVDRLKTKPKAMEIDPVNID